MRFFVTVNYIVLMSLLTTSCGDKNGAGAAGALLCSLLSSSVDQKSMTVGFESTFLEAIGSDLALQTQKDQEELNLRLKDTLNNALDSIALGESLQVKEVEEVKKSSDPNASDDGIRFLSFEGNLASGVNFVSDILSNSDITDSLIDSVSLTASNPFTFLEDSYQVYPTLSHSPSTFAQQTSRQWAYDQTNLTEAKQISQDSSFANVKDSVTVAVIDTGVDLDHPALQDNLAKRNGEILSYDFANGDDQADDDQGHGTHCAGIIAAKKIGDDGMTGIAEALAPGKVQILPVKVLGSDGSGSTTAINKGIRWAMTQGADVISMSLGGGIEFSDLLESSGAENPIIRDAIDAGIIVVVAAGNENCPLGGNCSQSSLFVFTQKIEEYTVLPCSYNGSICVGATDPDATIASYSNYPSSTDQKGVNPAITAADHKRTSPDITAPGSAIYSTYVDGSYRFLDGTSMATPFVAGLAAIYKLKISESMQQDGLNAQEVFRNLLQSSELAVSEEDSQTRSFVGQVDTAYFMENLRAYAGGAPAGSPPALESVAQPEQGGNREAAPNLISLLCGG